MDSNRLIQISAWDGWLVEVSQLTANQYQCWVVSPDLEVLSNGSVYRTSLAAMAAGRYFIQRQQ